MIGQPIDRVDGPAKVTGTATYSAEEWGLGRPLYGFIVGATIARGKLVEVDTARAAQAPGVQRVLTCRDPEAAAQRDPDPEEPVSYSRAYPCMYRPVVRAYGDPVALVVATTFEQARAAANLVEVTYEAAAADLVLERAQVYRPEYVNAFLATDSIVGSVDDGIAASAVVLDEIYTTPYQFAHPLELHATVAAWSGDTVTVHVATQIVTSARARIAATFGLEPHQVTIASPFVGGGFGSKLGVHADAILAVLAARVLRRPVKIVLARQQVPMLIGHRPESRQRMRLGAERDGTLNAYGHEVVMKVSHHDDYVEQTATVGRALYAAPNRRSTHRGARMHLPPSEDVRAPGEAPGLLAVECAMDELAHRLELDPVELRIKNEPERHPETGQPFGGRRLVQCLREGAQRFGWERRSRTPKIVRDGRAWVGYGMAAAIRPHFQWATSAEVTLDRAGIATLRSDMTDIGTGTYTIVTQVVAEALGLPIERVRVLLGRSEFPVSGGSGGSWGATNVSVAAYRACLALRDRLAAAAVADARSPLHGRDPALAQLADGRLQLGDASEAIAELVARAFPTGVTAEGAVAMMTDDPAFATYSHSTYGAHFAEVQVDGDTGEVRLRRMLGVFDVGRVLNPKTSRSQLLGGMIWGVGSALHEDGALDPRSGAFVARDLASYLVPVHADIPAIDVHILEGPDLTANELGMKGLGELGICGAGAAIANAVFNATGIRVRDFPITIEKLLPAL